MNTPIYSFIENYIARSPVRMHMPGHKGRSGPLGVEPFDITEIDGADELYHAGGIIRESEENASAIFGAHTFYSAEGSSLSIRAMLFLTMKWCRLQGKEPLILTARNVHKTYINTAALLDFRTEWIMGKKQDSYEECRFSAGELSLRIDSMKEKPAAVYITSPDYLGNIADIQGISKVCHDRGVLLLVDNAHGAYLKFLSPSLHPMDLGADLCADSAHKTLPVLTGGAYLHVSRHADSFFYQNAKRAMELFGSSSPSYLILSSLDLANPMLLNMKDALSKLTGQITELKAELKRAGYRLRDGEILKIVICLGGDRPKRNGRAFADALMQRGIYPEYYDEKHLVMMLSVNTGAQELSAVRAALLELAVEYALPAKEDPASDTDSKNAKSDAASNWPACNSASDRLECTKKIARFECPEQAMSPRDALFSAEEEVSADQCAGRILSGVQVSCPPAVPIYMMGERMDEMPGDERRFWVVKE